MNADSRSPEIASLNVLRMSDLDLRGKRVMIREDLNVPVKDGVVTSDARIRACLPTIEQALAARARVMLLSHLGRPEEGHFSEQYSLAPVAVRLSELLGRRVRLVRDWLAGVELEAGEVVLCENVRFNPGEKRNDEALARRMAALCEIFVMDAFGTAHRSQASTVGVAKYAPVACAGPLLVGELVALQTALENPARPLVAIVGGAKASTKLAVLESLLDKVDHLVVGGGIANTFLAASGQPVGKSLHEPHMLEMAAGLLTKADRRGVDLPLPTDVVVADELSARAEADVKSVAEVGPEEMILDLGPDTAERIAGIVGRAGTVVWNGPLGVFEFDQFGEGTRVLAEAIAESSAFSIAGGGDTLAAVEKYQVGEDLAYISTGGGAFLEFLEGKTLPAVAMLERRARDRRSS